MPDPASGLRPVPGGAGGNLKGIPGLIHGCPTQPAGTWEDLLWKDSAKNKVFVVRRMRKGVKAAKLAYRVLEEATPLTLVHIRLYTGRTHQIRVQFASRGPSGRGPQVRQPG